MRSGHRPECARIGTAPHLELTQVWSRSAAYVQKAKHAASDLAFGKDVTVQTHSHDKYGRTIADVLLPDGTNVNHALVKDGWWWWYWKNAQGCAVPSPGPVLDGETSLRAGGRSRCSEGRRAESFRRSSLQEELSHSFLELRETLRTVGVRER
jgi:hypothetical protein